MLGDKIASKNLAIRAGVPVVPGHDQPVSDLDEVRTIAAEIGYPVLLKPAAGGGGRGMRIVHGPEELASALKAGQERRPAKPLETTRYSWNVLLKSPGISRSRSWPISTAMSSIWVNGSAPSSGATRRKSSRKHPPWP